MEYQEIICGECKLLLPNGNDECANCGSNKKEYHLIFAEQMFENYTNRVIAFIDILGFKDMIENKSKFSYIYEQLLFLKGRENSEKWNLELIEIEEDAQKKDVTRFDISKSVICTCFSDTIVVSAEYIQENINEVVSTLIANISQFGAKLISEGILIRGAITIGELFHSKDGVIFGKALIDAHNLEKKAKYPRIILSNKLISNLNYPCCSKRERYPYHQYINRFDDGFVGFHQMIYYQVLESWTKMTDCQLKNDLEKIRHIIIKGLDASFENPEVYEKYNWLKCQYNELIILRDGIKTDVKKLNENIAGQNIHFKYTDDFYENIREC